MIAKVRLSRLFCCGVFLLPLLLSLPCQAQESQHALALHGAPRYGADFAHFDYADPAALKGGELHLASIGTFDTLNPFTLKGLAGAGTGMVFETLMEKSLDEPFTAYGKLAQSLKVAADRSWISFKLREAARFNDGTPVTADDVIFSFETLRDKGHPFYRSYYKDVTRAEKLGPLEVKFTFKGPGNTELPLIMGDLPVFPKHAWQGKDFAATTLEPLIGSGPYVVEKVTPGRSLTLKRAAKWWGAELPLNKGRYNFERIEEDYYRDSTVAVEAFLAGRYDVRPENVAQYWATAYTTPAVKSGLVVKREIPDELPSGMQAFVMNLRRPLFQDRRVREALALAFDFEWSNKTLAYGTYARTKSYFMRSELAATGLPSPEEIKLLEPFKASLPPELFTQAYAPPKTDGSGDVRDNLRRAAALLAEAGWTLQNGKLVNAKGEPFSFEIVDQAPIFEKWIQPYIRNLERLGISARFRVVDSAQFQNRLDGFDFDMTIHVFPQSISPGNEQRDFWGSAKADQKGSRNLAGIKNPAVDSLIETLIHAKDRESLVTAARALDRVLLWNDYVIPQWHAPALRYAYWDLFGQPKITPRYGFDMADLWWIDPAKEAKIRAAQKRNP